MASENISDESRVLNSEQNGGKRGPRSAGRIGAPLACTIVASVIALIVAVVQSGPQGRGDSHMTGNPTSDRLATFSEAERGWFFGRLADCPVDKTFLMGIDTRTDEAYWSFECAGARSYEVEIEPDPQGSSSIVDCDVVERFVHVQCFVKFEDQ